MEVGAELTVPGYIRDDVPGLGWRTCHPHEGIDMAEATDVTVIVRMTPNEDGRTWDLEFSDGSARSIQFPGTTIEGADAEPLPIETAENGEALACVFCDRQGRFVPRGFRPSAMSVRGTGPNPGRTANQPARARERNRNRRLRDAVAVVGVGNPKQSGLRVGNGGEGVK